MKYKALLLDIDNTLYDYDKANCYAQRMVVQFCVAEFKMTETQVSKAYSDARKKVHIELSETAASHNRLLYFQKMCGALKVNPLLYGLRLYNIYWDTFLAEMKPFDGVYDLLAKYKNKICLVTDLTAHIQYRKMETLNLSEYCDVVVTSEEAGREKPHPYMFMLALQKLGFGTSEVCMIGDSFHKDIVGASNLGINSIWFNHQMKSENFSGHYIQMVHTFDQIGLLV